MAYRKIPVAELMPPLLPVRRVADDERMQDLILSIATTGLLHPLVVVPENGQYRILAGHRRYIAVKHLGWEEVDCNVLDVDRGAQANITITENLMREEVNAVDLGWFLRHLVEHEGCSKAEVGERLGRSQPWVSRRIALTQLPDRVQAAIQQGQLNWRAALELSRIENDDTREAYTREAISRELSHAEVRRQVDNYKRYESQINTGVEVATQIRQEQRVESHPLSCTWCGAPAAQAPGEMIWLCSSCLRALLESREQQPESAP